MRLLRRTPIAVLLFLVAAGCGGSGGSGSADSKPSSSKPSSSEPTATSAPATKGCAKADFCKTFDQDTDGLPEDNQADYFAGYDTYLGGTYRVTIRKVGAVVPLPVDTGKLANDYGSQLDADLTVGAKVPDDAEIGFTCFAADDGPGGFVVAVTPTTAMISVAGADGALHRIAAKPASVLAASTSLHLTVTCQQKEGAAAISMSSGGTELVSTSYGNSTKNYGWRASGNVDIWAKGAGADVFFDNLGVTGACLSSC